MRGDQQNNWEKGSSIAYKSDMKCRKLFKTTIQLMLFAKLLLSMKGFARFG